MPNRFVCSALSEMRDHLAKMEMFFVDISFLERIQFQKILLEEVQTYVNRMESSLADKWDMKREQSRLTELKEERRELKKEIKELKKIRGPKEENE